MGLRCLSLLEMFFFIDLKIYIYDIELLINIFRLTKLLFIVIICDV